MRRVTNIRRIYRCTPLLMCVKNLKDNASVNSTGAQFPPPLRADPRALALFLALDGKFPGVGTLQLSNPPGWGRKKRANAPSSVNTETFFIDRTVK